MKVDRRTPTEKSQSHYHDEANGNDADHQSLRRLVFSVRRSKSVCVSRPARGAVERPPLPEEPFCSFYLPVRNSEIRIRHREVHNPLNQRSNERHQGPTEQQVDDAHSNFAKVEFMSANASEEQSEQCRRQAIAARR